jgi:HEAT repeat protein
VSARLALRVAVAASLAAGLLACDRGGKPPASAESAAPAATAGEPPASAPPSASTASSPAAGAPPSAERGRAEDRADEVLDTEPTGAGLDALIRSMKEDPDPSVRESAVVALGDSEEPRALDALIAATEDRDKRVVLAAIDQLSWFDDKVARDALERLTRSGDSEIADAATDALGD